MMKLNRMIAILLAVVFVLQTAPFGVASSAMGTEAGVTGKELEFSDIDGHWAENDMLDLAAEGVLTGYDQNGESLLAPDKAITRSEFAAIIVRAEKLELKKNQTGQKTFADVKVGDWFFSDVAIVASNGIMVGDNGLFRPKDYVTRAEIAAVMARVAGYKDEALSDDGVEFLDLSKSCWYYKYVVYCYQNGLIKGYSDHTFKGGKHITRAESFAVLNRFLIEARAADAAAGKLGSLTGTDPKTSMLYAISPSSGTLGTKITLHGSHFSGKSVKVLFTGQLHGTIELEPLEIKENEITVLAPVSLIETVHIYVEADGERTSAYPFLVEPLVQSSEADIDDLTNALDDLFTNLSSEIGNAFVSLPASEVADKSDQISELQNAVRDELQAFESGLTAEEKRLINLALSNEGFADSLEGMNEASEILSHSDAEEAIDNIAKAKDEVDDVVDLLVELRAVLKKVKKALYYAAGVAAAASVFTGGAMAGTALDLYNLADKLGSLINTVISPCILALKTVSAILGMAPSVAVEKSFTTYSYSEDIQINQYFGSLAMDEVSPVSALMSGAVVMSAIPQNLTSINAADNTISINEQISDVSNQIAFNILSGTPSTEENYRLRWRLSLWQEIKEYMRVTTGLEADSTVLPSSDIGYERFLETYYPSIHMSIPGDFDDWIASESAEDTANTNAALKAWKAYVTYASVNLPEPMPNLFTLTANEQQIVNDANEILQICQEIEDKPADQQPAFFKTALAKADGMAEDLNTVRERIESAGGVVKSALKEANRAVAFYKTSQHVLDNEYTRAFKQMAGDLKALSEEMDSYLLLLDDTFNKMKQRVALLKACSDGELEQKLQTGSIDNSTLVVFINEPYSFEAHMDFVPADNRDLDDVLDNLWVDMFSCTSDTLLGEFNIDFNQMINNKILEIIADLLLENVDNPLDSVLEDLVNLSDVGVDIVMEVEDDSVLEQPSGSAQRVTIKGLKPGITKVKLYPARITDEDAREACTIERTVIVLSGDQTNAPYTMGPRIDSALDREGLEVSEVYIGDEILFKGFGFSMKPETYNNQTYSFNPPAGVSGEVEDWMVFENTYTTAGLEIPDTMPTALTVNVGMNENIKWPSNTDFVVLPPRVDNKTGTAIVGEAWPAFGQGYSHTPQYNQGIFGNMISDIIQFAYEEPTSLPTNYSEDMEVDAYTHETYKKLHKELNFVVPDMPIGQSTFRVSMYNNQLYSNEKEIVVKKFGSIGEVKYDWGNDHAVKPDLAIDENTGDGLVAWTRSGIDGYYPQVVVAPVLADGTIGTSVVVSEDVGGLDASPSKVSMTYFGGFYYLTFANRANDIVVTRSQSGTQWTTPFVVNVTAAHVDRFPVIAALDADGDGDTELAVSWTQEASVETGKSCVMLAYLETAFGAYSTAKITTFSDGSYDSDLVIENNHVTLVYAVEKDDTGSDLHLFMGGALPVLMRASGNSIKLTSNNAGKKAGNPSAAISSKDGSVYTVWENTGDYGNEDVFFAKVGRDGEILENYNMSKSNRQSLTPKLEIDNENIPVVVWFETGYASGSRSSVGFQTDLMFARSFNDGKTFNAPYLRLDTSLNGIRMAAPALSAYDSANITVTYQFTDEEQAADHSLGSQRGIKLVSTDRAFADKTIQSSFDSSDINPTTEHILRVYSDQTFSDAKEIRPENMPEGNVYLSDLHGNNLTQLTRSGKVSGYVGNDTKARYISYSTNAGVFVAEADGTNAIRIASAPESQEIAGVIWKGTKNMLFLSTQYDAMINQTIEYSTLIRFDGAELKSLDMTSTGFTNYPGINEYLFNDVDTDVMAWTSQGKPTLENCQGIAFGTVGVDNDYQLPGKMSDRWATYSGLRAAYISFTGPAHSSIEDRQTTAYEVFGTLNYKTDPLNPWGTVLQLDTNATMPTVSPYGKVTYIKDQNGSRRLYYIANALSPQPLALEYTSGADELYPLFTSAYDRVVSHTLKGGDLRIKVVNPVTGECWFVGAETGFSGIASTFESGEMSVGDAQPPVFNDAKIGVSSHSGNEYTLNFTNASDTASGVYQYEITMELRDLVDEGTTSETIYTTQTNTILSVPSDREGRISVVAIDYAGNKSLPLEFMIGANDAAIPTGVTLQAHAGADYAIFDVSAVDNSQVGYYELYIDGALMQSSLAPTTQIRVDGLSSHTEYEAVLKVYDGRMNVSQSSVDFTTLYGYTKISFASAVGSIAENSDYSTVATLTRTGDLPTGTISVEISFEDITAVRNQDYGYSANSSTYSVYLAEGEDTSHISVRTDGALNNVTVDGPKTFKIKITMIGSNNAVIGETSECIVTINDEDVLTNTVSFDSVGYSVAEGAGNVLVKVSRVSGSGTYSACKVIYTSNDGTAKAGTDYTAVNGQVSFAEGETEKTITVPILQNTLPDGNRSFTIVLSGPTNGVTIGTVDMASVTIEDDDTSVAPPNVAVQDNNTQFPGLLVTGIHAGEKIRLYKLNSNTSVKEQKGSDVSVGGESWTISNLNSYGSGTYYVTRIVNDIESDYSVAASVAVYVPTITYVPQLSKTITVEKGTNVGTVKLTIAETNKDASKYYYYGVDAGASREGNVQTNTALGSEMSYATTLITGDVTDNITATQGWYLNIYEVNGADNGGTIVAITTIIITTEMIKE